jgi:hypothetical protein
MSPFIIDGQMSRIGGGVFILYTFCKGSCYIHFLIFIISQPYCAAWIPVFTKKGIMNLQMQDNKAPVPIAIDKKIVGLGVGAYSDVCNDLTQHEVTPS